MGRNVTCPENRYPANRLYLGLGRGQFVGLHNTLERCPLMAAIAEGLVLGMAAAAETQLGPPREAEWLGFLIQDFEIAFHHQGPIICDCNFCPSHSIPPVKITARE